MVQQDNLNSDFSLYNNFYTAVLVIDSTERIIFKNYQFIKTFGNVRNLDKFSNYFSFDICMLDTENILKANPISFAAASEESYTAIASYQKSNYLYFRISAFFDKGAKILAFKDITDTMRYENLEKNYERLNMKCALLEDENKEFSKSRQKAQNQAIKMALMHRVSNVIRESIDISKIINSALKELSNLFGASKVYFAKYTKNNFVLEYVYPAKYKNVLNEKIEFEEKTKKFILSKNICTNPCLKEYLNSKNTFPAPLTRIIAPVYRLHEFLGILIIYTNKSQESQNDILQSIATQLASAITQAELFNQINTKNEQLQKTLTELKETQLQLINAEKMASLGQLVAGVAHEINTPLASINSNNGILNMLIAKLNGTDEKTLKTIESINALDKEAIKRIMQIVQSLKRFVRLDESDLQETDINKELDITLELIRHETKNRIAVNKNYSQIPLIKCYPNMLNQVFMNVLINACQSIKDRGEITITTLYKDSQLTVKIKDNGAGIDENIKNKLFSAGTTTKKTGTGLGLAISQKIIEKHNGSITFTSKKGKGTEFTIAIPNL